MEEALLELILSAENVDAINAAYMVMYASLVPERVYRDMGRGFNYPFGQNQAEWENSLFTRGWNAAIAHKFKKGE